ncbi:PepSY-associated TM helix domain-containing protein [Sphingobacterium sp. Mn56C]|uniref:PepSY-associated TM helix domain-containing protein n=1 Tax=Sphingobacterium sp. Mn56C TaxID=3395261 RepID=UPI003BC64419
MKKFFLKINAWLHLWLGLVSGIIVIILSVTGCVLVFEHDFKALVYNYIHVEEQSADKQLPPSELYKKIKAVYPDKEVESVWYYGLDKSVKAGLEDFDSILYVNPYSGEVLAAVDHDDIFHFMDEGHRRLWMPRKVGRQVVGWGTLVFFIVTVSGIIMWWPKKWNKRMVKQSFTLNWKASLKRINYDLHNVLGFYSLTLALLMALTGLIMAFPWMRKSVMWLSGGIPPRPKIEKVLKPADAPDPILQDALLTADKIWYKVRHEIAQFNTEAIIIHYPEPDEETVYACTDMHNGRWRDLSFDRNSLALLPRTQKSIKDTNTAEWIARSNYALHTGFIGGMPTKILYFSASLICASLPITGFYIWWGKKRKKKKK